MARAWSDYRKIEVQKPAIQATNILVFTLLTLALLFAAIWTGLTLARRTTAPIVALAESTRRITEGDLTAEVAVPASDELGVLVESFNRMTAEIRDNRQRLESSNRDLTDINRRLDRERQLLSTILETARTGSSPFSLPGRFSSPIPRPSKSSGSKRRRRRSASSRAAGAAAAVRIARSGPPRAQARAEGIRRPAAPESSAAPKSQSRRCRPGAES